MDFNERRRIDQSGISYAILTAIIILLILILWSHLAVAANPSFDCRKATMEDEFAICSDDDLSDRDNEVAAAFRQLKRVVGNQKSREIARYWLDIRHSCGSDTECIGNVQRNAINEFMSYVNRHDDNGSALQHLGTAVEN